MEKSKQEGARFRILDLRTNRKFDVEAIHQRRKPKTEFGDSLDSFCNGSIPEDQSSIAPETHSNIEIVSSPTDEVSRRLKK